MVLIKKLNTIFPIFLWLLAITYQPQAYGAIQDDRPHLTQSRRTLGIKEIALEPGPLFTKR